MISPEQFINDLQKQILKLEEELAEAKKDIEDFEILAVEWKKGHSDLKRQYDIKLTEKDQIINELEDEIDELRAKQYFDSN